MPYKDPERRRQNDRRKRAANSARVAEYQRQWREKNVERRREYNRQYRLANRDRLREANRQWQLAHAEELREYGRNWREKNPGKAHQYTLRRDHKRDNQTKRCWRDKNTDKVKAAAARQRATEQYQERQQQWRVDNHERYLEAIRQWRLRNPEKVKEHNDTWPRENPERHREHIARRRARKLSVSSTFTAEDWRTLVARSPHCHWCGKHFTKKRLTDGSFGPPTHDHVIALSAGGANALENSVCAHLRCNLRKHAGRFNPITGQGILL